MVTLIWLAACAPAPEEPVVERRLEAREILVRASLDVRGVRPSPDEIEAVVADPESVGERIAQMVQADGFAERVADLFAPAFRTRIDQYPLLYDRPDVQDAIGEEPLDLIRTLVLNDASYAELVLADYTVVRPEVMDLWPVQAIDDAVTVPEGTTLARYTDGRPHAGVLSTNALWWRHGSTLENANRGRANALSRALLCESFLDRPIDFPSDLDLSDSQTIRDAIRTNPGCTACHATLDPLASYLWGFMYEGEGLAAWAEYRVERERDWLRYTDRPPGFFGEPGESLLDLGAQIASDERFVACGVKRVYEGLLGRRVTPDDDGALAEHRDAFVSGGLTLSALVQSVLADPRYQGRSEPSTYGGHPPSVALKVITPDQLESELEALTGYRMTIADRDVLRLDSGLRAVAGGGDQGAATLPSTGLLLVHRRLAEAAATAVVDGTVSGGTLAPVVSSWQTEPSREELVALVLATVSRPLAVDGEEVDALLALWRDLHVIADAPTAHKGLLTALLADPQRLVF